MIYPLAASGGAATGPIFSAIIAGIVSVLTVIYVAKQQRTSVWEKRIEEASTERLRVESQAFDRARDSYENALQTALAQATRLEQRISDCERRAEAAEARAENAESRASQLSRQVVQLTDVILRAGLTIPPLPPSP